MKILKNKVSKTIVIIAIIAVLCASAFGAYVGGRAWTNKINYDHAYEEVYSMGGYSLETDEEGEFRVLKINDTHFINGEIESDRRTLEGIKRVLDSTLVDLIVMAGDLVEGFNLNVKYDKEKAIRKFSELMENYDIPWTFIPGNNDGEVDGSTREVISLMLSYEHFITGNVKDVYGDTQFYVDIMHEGQRVHLLAFLDTGARKPQISGSYDHLRQSQIANLKSEISTRGVKTSLFIHMPSPAFGDAYENGIDYENMPKRLSSSYKSIPKNALFDKELEGEKLLTLISNGHQHGNDLCSHYNGRYYQLSSPSGYTAWMPKEVSPSVTLTTIDTQESNPQLAYHFEKIAV